VFEEHQFIGIMNRWQEVQAFCADFGFAIQIIGEDGEGVQKRGEGCEPCRLVLTKREGFTKCLASYRTCFSEKKTEPFSFYCHLELFNFVFPIVTRKLPSACIVAGGIIVDDREKEVLSLMKEIGIEEEKAKKALSSIKIVEKGELSTLQSLVKLALSPLAEEIDNHLQLFVKAKEAVAKEEFVRIDEMTGLHNRLYLTKRAEEEMSRARRMKHPLSLIIFCLDQFENLTDLYGSSAETSILKETAEILLGFTRKEDVLARGMGDEFLLLLPNLAQDKALILAERIERKIKEHTFCEKEGLSLRLTISCGISEFSEEESAEEFLEKAERALLSAKAKGGEKILLHSVIKKEEPKRCVITGIGILTPIGIGKDAFWQNLSSGRSGIDRITQFDVTNMPVKIAGEVKDFDPLDFMDRKSVKRSDRATQFAIAASQQAIADSQLSLDREKKDEIQVIIGAGVGGLSFAEEQVSTFLTNGPEKISPYLSIITFSGALSSMVSLELDLKGASITVSTGCPAGTDAIGYGFFAIKKGETEIVIAGGAEAPVRPVVVHSFYTMHALSLRNDKPEKASRPFDAERDGFVIAEGAGIVILEELEHALNRGAKIYGEVVSYASTNDAYHMTAPAPDGKAAAMCFRLALEEAGISPEDVDYINPHGSSTPLNDRIETLVIKEVFSDSAYKIPVSSTKSMLGHSIGATGAVEAIICALSITNRFIPPTINYEFPDPECDLDYVPNEGREKDVNVAFTNSFGFGGKNSALVIKRFEDF
jgi:3-oxoacyl-[acyl-carrier-protein] synthase II